MRHYGGNIPCANCGNKHYVEPKQLQAELQIFFICKVCGMEVLHANAIAREIADHFETIRYGLSKLRI